MEHKAQEFQYVANVAFVRNSVNQVGAKWLTELVYDLQYGESSTQAAKRVAREVNSLICRWKKFEELDRELLESIYLQAVEVSNLTLLRIQSTLS